MAEPEGRREGVMCAYGARPCRGMSAADSRYSEAAPTFLRIIYMSDVNSTNNVLPDEKVSSTGGNTAAYETAYTGGKKKSNKKSAKKTSKRRVKKGIFSSLKRLFKMPTFGRRKTAKR